MLRPNVVAIIPARGGSKGLPRKNLQTLLGKPLLAYSIEAALNCPYIGRVIVSTEDSEINRVAREYGAEILERPQALAGDTIQNDSVVKHVIENIENDKSTFEYIALLQPTSPLRNAKHLEECLFAFLKSSAKSTVSVCMAETHPAKYFILENGYAKPYGSLLEAEERRQALPSVFRQNGAIYAISKEIFKNTGRFLQMPCLPYIMNVEESVDIDTLIDLKLAELILGRNKKDN